VTCEPILFKAREEHAFGVCEVSFGTEKTLDLTAGYCFIYYVKENRFVFAYGQGGKSVI